MSCFCPKQNSGCASYLLPSTILTGSDKYNPLVRYNFLAMERSVAAVCACVCNIIYYTMEKVLLCFSDVSQI